MYANMKPWVKRDLRKIFNEIKKLKKVAIIAHVDLDGWMAAYAVYAWLVQCKDECEFEVMHFQWDYGDNFDEMDKKVENAVVFLLDLILPDKFMEKHAERLVWIDHHKPAIENSRFKSWKYKLLGDGSRDTIGCTGGDYTDPDKRAAACELAHMYFFHGLIMPPAIFLAGRYDVHDAEFMPKCNHFNAYMQTYFSKDSGAVYTREDFRNIVMPIFSRDGCEFRQFHRALKEGKALCEHRNIFWNVDCENYANIVTMLGRRIIAVNRRGISSDYFTEYYQSRSALFLSQIGDNISTLSWNGSYDHDNQLWIFSCYDLDDMDQAFDFVQKVVDHLPPEAIATFGGHPGACGLAIHRQYVSNILDMMEPLDLN